MAFTSITAEDGFTLPAYFSLPNTMPKGGIVLIQEIFGVTKQLRELAQEYAALGYAVIVPNLFARVSDTTMLSYNQAEEGLRLASLCKHPEILFDIQAAVNALQQENDIKPQQTSVIGFCWGGGLAYLAASELTLKSGIAYYGTRLGSYLPRQPKCPFQFHFGETDTHSPSELISKMQQHTPNSDFFVYPEVGHAFANHHKDSFNQDATYLAQQRVLSMLGS